MKIRITTHCEADAQGIFDVLHGSGVTWREPATPNDVHTLTAERPGVDLIRFLRECFPSSDFNAVEL